MFPGFYNTTRSFRSIPLIIAFMMIPVVIAAVIGWYALDLIAGLGIATGFAKGYISTLKNLITVFDSIAIFIFAIAFGSVIIRSFKANAHPLLGIIGLMFMPVVVIGAAYAANVFGVFSGLGFLSGALNHFAFASAFFNNTAVIASAAGVLVLLVMVGGGLRGR